MYLSFFYTKNKLLILGCILFAYSCNTITYNANKIESVKKNDSIIFWIQRGKSNNTSKEKRSIFLEKAFKAANEIKIDSIKANYFSKLSLAYLRLNDSSLFRKINSKAIMLANKTSDSTYLAEAYWDLAMFLKKNAVIDSAYYYYNEAQKIYHNLNDDFYSARMLYDMAIIQSNIGDYTGSEITNIKAIELFKPLNEYKRLYGCYNLLGNSAASIKEYSRALEYHNEALYYLQKDKEDKKKEDNKLIEQSTNNNLGVVYQKKGQHKKAISYLSKVVSYDSIYHKAPRLYARALNNLGYNKCELNETHELPYLFTKAFAIFDSIGNITGQSSTLYNLAKYYLKQGDSTKAYYNIQRAKSLAQQVSDNERLLETLRMLSKIDPKNVASYTQEYVTLSDSLQQQERKIRNKFARIRFETDEINAENQLVNAENQLLAKQKQIWVGIAIILLVIGVAIFIIINQRTKNRILEFREKQQASNQEIFNLLMAQKQNIEEGKQIEQKRISEELHDGVLGKMLGARMMLIGLNKKMNEEAISERAKAISILQGIEGEVRSISHELSHAAYQKIHNFIMSIKDLVKTIQNSSEIEFNFKFAETLDWDALTGDIKINLYRMVQEILQNSVKHSECTAIELNFTADVEFLKITIADNGKGFHIKKGRKGIGMRNIASRISKVNGTWDIDSEISKGTTITLVIPIILNDNEDITDKIVLHKNL